jgi:hypothetical protein
MGHAPETETLKLNAGDAVGFAHQSYDPQGWTPNQWNCRDGRGSCDPDSAAYRDDHGDYMVSTTISRCLSCRCANMLAYRVLSTLDQ